MMNSIRTIATSAATVTVLAGAVIAAGSATAAPPVPAGPCAPAVQAVDFPTQGAVIGSGPLQVSLEHVDGWEVPPAAVPATTNAIDIAHTEFETWSALLSIGETAGLTQPDAVGDAQQLVDCFLVSGLYGNGSYVDSTVVNAAVPTTVSGIPAGMVDVTANLVGTPVPADRLVAIVVDTVPQSYLLLAAATNSAYWPNFDATRNTLVVK